MSRLFLIHFENDTSNGITNINQIYTALTKVSLN
jgi:hypothetical protein